MSELGNDKANDIVDVDFLTTIHSRQKPDQKSLHQDSVSIMLTAATPLTGNCSTDNNDSGWIPIGQQQLQCAAEASTKEPIDHRNCHSGLDFDKHCVAVNSGASKGFGKGLITKHPRNS